MALLGYARVSTRHQSPALQLDALAEVGADQVWTDVASGTRTARPQLTALLDYARPGDTLAVWRLDRLGRSVPHLVATLTQLDARGIQFRSLVEQIDTTTAHGRLFFHMAAALAQFEADLVHERTEAGLAAARARGRLGGRPKALTPAKRAAAAELLAVDGATVTSVAAALDVSRATIYRYLDQSG